MSKHYSLAQQLKMSEEDFDTVKEILQQFIPQYDVRAFGSRVTGTNKPFSDLDLVVMTQSPLEITTLGSLMEALSESDLPFRVDVVDWATLSPTFQHMIQQNFLRLQKAQA